jgi:hypothetical protein
MGRCSQRSTNTATSVIATAIAAPHAKFVAIAIRRPYRWHRGQPDHKQRS